MTVGELLDFLVWLDRTIASFATTRLVDVVFCVALVVFLACVAWWRSSATARMLLATTLHRDQPGLFRLARSLQDLLGVRLGLPLLAPEQRVIRLTRMRIEWALLRGDDDEDPPLLLRRLAEPGDAGDPRFEFDTGGGFARGAGSARDGARDTGDDPDGVRLQPLSARDLHRAAMLDHRRDATRRRRVMYAWLDRRSRGSAPLRRLRAYVLDHRERACEWRAAWIRRHANGAGAPAEPPPVNVDGASIPVPDCFTITQRLDGIARYFAALSPPEGIGARRKAFDPPGRFLAPVRIEAGFVAPLHLVAGLNTEFDEDWRPAIDYYGARTAPRIGGAAEGASALPASLARLQAFQFACWVTWGPSIPVCSCRAWRGWADRPVLQYGFGDENNSVPLVFGRDERDTALGLLAARGALARSQAIDGLHVARGPAALAEGPSPAQRSIGEKEAIVLATPGALGVRGRGGPARPALGAAPVDSPRPYYSAYVWVMFEIVPPGAVADGTDPDRLLPFFEHGNIADPALYAQARRQLARKVIGTLADLKARHPDLAVRYAYAIDDANCGGTLHEAAVVSPTIRSLMAEELAGGRSIGARGGLDAASLGLAPTAPTAAAAGTPHRCACHVPDVLGTYFGKVRGESR